MLITFITFISIYNSCIHALNEFETDDDIPITYFNFKVPDQTLLNQVQQAVSPEPGLILAVPCSDRTVWENKQRQAQIMKIVQRADETIYGTPLPPWSDAFYLEYSSSGGKLKENGIKMMDNRTNRLFPMAMAECYYNSGNYTEQLNRELKAIASQKSWSYPAHGNYSYILLN